MVSRLLDEWRHYNLPRCLGTENAYSPQCSLFSAPLTSFFLPFNLPSQQICLDWRQLNLGEHAETGAILNFIGMAHLQLGHNEEAKSFFEQVSEHCLTKRVSQF